MRIKVAITTRTMPPIRGATATGTKAPIRAAITALIFMVAVIMQAVTTTASITSQVITPLTVRFLSTLSRSHSLLFRFQGRYRAIDKWMMSASTLRAG
jgi:hypothetical protein